MSRYLAIFRDAQRQALPPAVSADSAISPAAASSAPPNGTNDTNGNGWSASKRDAADEDDGWIERAALTQFDGGLPCADAEALADAEHPPDPATALPSDWVEWYATEVRARSRRMTRAEAQRRVWGLALTLWHLHHGARPDPSRCAGCGGPLGSLAWTLPDGARAHDDQRAVECLSAYGERWRFTASRALAAAGLTEPGGDR